MAEENNRKNKLISDKQNTYFTENRIMKGSAIPTEGTYLTGDMIINTNPVTSIDEPMWICNQGGTPGVWGPVSNTSTTIVPNFANMKISKATVGGLFYVIADESDADDGGAKPGFYIITSVKENENGVKVPATWDKINKKENTIPKLSYDPSMPEGTKMYLNDDQELIIRFNFTANTFGDGKYRAYINGSLAKSWSGAKGNIIVNLGKITSDGTYEITVTATDYLTVPAPETLSYKVIVGGLKLTSTFEQTLLTAIYEEGDTIEFPYMASLADASQSMKMRIKLVNNGTGETVYDDSFALEGTFLSTIWKSPVINKAGLYTITAQAYTGSSVSDTTEGTFKSHELSYDIRVLKAGEIAILDESKGIQYDTNMYVSIPFKIVSRIADYFVMKGQMYKDVNGHLELVAETSNTGISAKVNVTNYWSVGKLEAGMYKYVIKGYTVDGGVESDPVEVMMEVVESLYQKVPFIDNANLIAYFDANTKGNNDGSPNIWGNSSRHTGDKYRILLHGLNYSSNGWKHVDESIPDSEDGEMMLKFTGESYGELVEMVNGEAKPYSPFSIFKMGGQKGITIETAIRTRNIGELNARVMTCTKFNNNMENPLNEPGINITYDTMAIASNAQVNSLGFMEDEWVHITLVVDKDIRTFEKVGQNMIEDVNPTYTLRVYINGVMCSCTTINEDESKENFLDGAKEAYPLVLNACRMIDAAGNVSFTNFGECEIKFIRIYNSFLKSSEVLQNYISHIYDSEEQQRENDKNNTDLATLPTIVFKRKIGEGYEKNATFATLHSIKDKKTSKKTFVDCVMEYNDGAGNIVVYDNMDVYLQGTSSLQYPVKNYKIKAWVDAEKESKLKFVPPGMEDNWVKDSKYTLKCDYMEQSHKNNTPTARFYNQVIDALGGMSPAKKDGYHDAIDGFPCIVYYNEGGVDADGKPAENVLVGSFMFNIDKEGKELGFECDLYDEIGDKVGSGKNSCISYEATANASDTAGCFYKLSESIVNVYNYYLEDSYKEYLEKYGLTPEKCTMDQFKAGIIDGTIEEYMTFEEFSADYSETDYIMSDFEARYSYCEDDEEATYKPMIELVNWVSNSIDNGTFKKDFDKHLDLNYMIAYYLQMHVFTQVDNCGKNSMWDTWDGVKFYPRPYDMDTQMGLSNTGTEIIRVDSEIIPSLSPTLLDGDKNFIGYSYTDTTTDLRYMNYNTRTSKLWNAFGTEFKEEIKKAYTTLRNAKVYDVDNIFKAISADTDDKIGKIYFNKDAASKYLSQTTATDSTYLQMLHGNRAQKYKKFLKERIIFLDTVFGYEESAAQPDTLNSYIGLRSDAAYGQGEGTTLRCYVGVSVYSPQYVTITIGSGADGKVTGYVGPESRYKDPDTGIEYEGALFSFPIKGINKEMGITGAGNIKQINRLQTLNLTEARIEKALKLLELDVSYSNRMEGLKIGNNKYLRHLNCTNSYRLGTATESQTLDLSNCVNLKTVDLSYTKFTGVMFPTDTVLNSINLTSSSIKNVSIDGAEFLDDIKITNCENINKFELNRCNRITKVDVANSTIQNFIVTNCENVTEVNLSGCKSIAGFDVTNSYNIVTLNMSGNTSPVMNDLKLYSMYKLNKLIISQTDTVHTLRLPKYLNEEEAFKAVNGDPNAKLWDNLTYLDASTSSIRKIQYGSGDVDDVVLDMSQLKKLTTLKLSNCTYFTEIRNINYTGPLASLFFNCRSLTKITGVLTNGNASINSMFQQCFVLSDIDGLSLNFTGVTSANSTCDRCFRMKTPMLKKILYACGESLTSATSMCHMAGLDGYETILGTAEDTTRTIPSDLFAMNTKLQNVSGFFDITGYTTVPGDLFDPCGATLTNCNNTFGRMGNLTTVGASLLHNKPNLTTVSQMFASDESLTDYINESPDIFIGSYSITSTKQMFNNCGNLAVSEELGLGEMMKPLTNLTDASFMFYGCSNNLNCEIPDGFLSTNTKLVKINGMFQNCSKLPKLPASLFNKLGGTAKFPNLTKAVGVFGNCTSMEGIVESTFFLGAENLLNIGMDHEDNVYMGTTRYTSRGIFEGTQITGYHETFLNVVPKVQNVSGMFRDCTSLKDCHYYKGSQVETRNNGISEDLFIENKLLSDTYYMFAGCSSIEGHIPRNLLVNSKSLLKNVSYMFLNCSLLTGVNLDATSDNDVQTGICAEWFKNGVALTNVAGFMQGCSLYTGQIPDDMLEGCTSLQRTDSLFNGCKNIIGSIPLGLFDACRKTITTTASMFASCEGLDQPIPVGQYNEVEGIVEYELVAKGTEGAMQVVEVMEDPFTQVAYSDVVTLSPNLATIINASGNYYVLPKVGPKTEVVVPGLLANCIQLTSIANMFYACKKITGGIPHDLLFTENNNIKYTKLQDVSGLFYDCEKISELYHETETGIDYICSPMLFDKCPELVNCSSIFRAMPGIPSTANIHPQMFSKQNKVTNISYLFRCTNVTGAVSPLLFANSINTITSAAQMFAFSKVSSIGPNFLNGGGRNTKLKNIYGMFYGCWTLEGTAPEFWNGAKFTAMGGADSNGFAGALTDCTKLTNYATATAANTAWTADQPIYGE